MSRKQQSQKSIERLLKEFPEIWELYAPFSPEHAAEVYPGVEIDVRITVLRADPNLMYWRPNEVNGSGYYLMNANLGDLQGQRYEMPVFYDKDRKRISDLDLPGFRRDTTLMQVLFGHDALYKRLGTIALLSQVFWVDSAGTLAGDTAFVDNVRRLEARIIIYKAPRDKFHQNWVESGWSRLADYTDINHNVKLYGSMLVDSPKFDEIWYRELIGVIGGYAQNFQRLVWARDFGRLVDSSSSRGMKGQLGDIKVLTYYLAGRVQVQLERGNVRYTLIGQDVVGDPRFGIGSVDGTGDELAALIDDAIIYWTLADASTRQSCMADDSEIGIF